MPEYELRLRFTAANGLQASRLAEAWAGTCAAEYGTTYAGLWLAVGSQPSTHPVDVSAVACAWCGRAVVLGEHPVLDGEEWFCSHECDDACTDQTPSASGT